MTAWFAVATEVRWGLLGLQQQDGFVVDWLPGVPFRQQLLTSLDFEPQTLPLQQQEASPVVELKQNLLMEPSGQRQS